MKLSKIVPAHRVTITARWCRTDFTKMSPQWRLARHTVFPRQKDDPLGKCYWCKYVFKDGDDMALASFNEKIGNRCLCAKCAIALLASAEDEEVEES